MRVLGIDPGTHRTGWAVIEGDSYSQKALAYSCIEIPPLTESKEYLPHLHDQLREIIKSYRPDRAGIERIFFQKNKKTAISVAEARGVILYTLSESGVPYSEYTPNTIKSSVVGSGQADKSQVAYMVQTMLELAPSRLLDDTSDALGVALTAITGGTL